MSDFVRLRPTDRGTWVTLLHRDGTPFLHEYVILSRRKMRRFVRDRLAQVADDTPAADAGEGSGRGGAG